MKILKRHRAFSKKVFLKTLKKARSSDHAGHKKWLQDKRVITYMKRNNIR